MATLIGTTWKHKKRGGQYRVIGVIVADLSQFKDGDPAYWCAVHTPRHYDISICKEILPSLPREGRALVSAIPIRLQIDVPQLRELVIIYQSDSDGSIWGRSEDEFLDGRFERVPE